MDINREHIAKLVVEIQNDNRNAFADLYNITNQRAYFVALEFVKNEADAQDILQESYIKALEKIKELDKPESFQSWLNQIVANKSKDFLKKKKPMLFEAEEHEVLEVLPDEDMNFRPQENLDQNELQRTVMEVLGELSEEKRACVLMMYFEELSVSEIAQTLEIPEGTVKTRLFSARKDLKDKFEKRGITSAFSVAPFGVVLWAMRRSCISAGAAFAASTGSAKVLAGVTASTAASAAVASTATATTAGTATAKAASGIGAKITAMSLAKKIVAGVAAVTVIGSATVGAVRLVNQNDKNQNPINNSVPKEIYSDYSDFEKDEYYDNSFADSFEYVLDTNGNAILVKYYPSYDHSEVIIPSEIDEHKVVQIGDVEEAIEYKEDSYFGDDRRRLSENFGSCVFENCEFITKITIPASVEQIRDASFVKCEGLTEFVVDKNNKYFSTDKHGVLFNKDKTKLISFPIASETDSYIVPESVTEMSPGAFFNCLKLKNLKLSPNVKSIGSYSVCIGEYETFIIPEGVVEASKASILMVANYLYYPSSFKREYHPSFILSRNYYYAGNQEELAKMEFLDLPQGVTKSTDNYICNTPAPY